MRFPPESLHLTSNERFLFATYLLFEQHTQDTGAIAQTPGARKSINQIFAMDAGRDIKAYQHDCDFHRPKKGFCAQRRRSDRAVQFPEAVLQVWTPLLPSGNSAHGLCVAQFDNLCTCYIGVR